MVEKAATMNMFSVTVVASTGTSRVSVRGKERVASIRWVSDRLPPLASPGKVKERASKVEEKGKVKVRKVVKEKEEKETGKGKGKRKRKMPSSVRPVGSQR